MLVRKFTCMEHEEFGELGWRPDWLKHLGFEPSWDFGVSHDILEHMVDKIGGAEGELMAFGAVIWIRGESGRDISLEGDFSRILTVIENGDQTLNCPGRTYKLRDHDYWEGEMVKIVREGLREAREYYNVGDISLSESEIKRRAVGWMRKGFRKANAYYRTKLRLDSCSVAYIFDKITEIVNKNSKGMEIGETLTIRIDFSNCQVTGFRDYPKW